MKIISSEHADHIANKYCQKYDNLISMLDNKFEERCKDLAYRIVPKDLIEKAETLSQYYKYITRTSNIFVKTNYGNLMLSIPFREIIDSEPINSFIDMTKEEYDWFNNVKTLKDLIFDAKHKLYCHIFETVLCNLTDFPSDDAYSYVPFDLVKQVLPDINEDFVTSIDIVEMKNKFNELIKDLDELSLEAQKYLV